MPGRILDVGTNFRFCFYLLRRYLKKGFTPAAAPVLFVENTNVCNANCVFCPNKIMKRPRLHMDMGIFKKAVDDFADMGGAVLCFAPCVGEPLLDPLFMEKTRCVRRFAPQIQTLKLISTLQWLHKFNMDEIFDAGFAEMIVSITLSGREKYLEFFGTDNYEQTFKNLVELIRENKRRSNKTNINIYIRPTRESDEQVLNHPDFRLVNSLMDGALFPVVKYRFLADDWHKEVELPEYIKKPVLYPRIFFPCSHLYNSIIVFSDGKVGACPCEDLEADSDLILGDIRSNALKELWNGKRLAGLRDNWRKRNIVPGICRRCALFCPLGDPKAS